MKKNPAWLANLSLLVASFVLIFFLLFSLFEIFPALPSRLNLTRIYYYALKARYIPDPQLVTRIKPSFSYEGTFTGDISGLFPRSSYKPLPYQAYYDKNGFRNNHTDEKADIVVLGDSYMEVGLNNQDTFAAHLEKATQQRVANYGSGWYGPDQYLEAFKRYGLNHHPQFALFCFFEGNDLKDIDQYKKWQKGGSYYHFNSYNGNFLTRFFLATRDSLAMLGKLVIRRWDPRRAEIKLGDKIFQTVFVYSPDLRSPEELSQSLEIQKFQEILTEFQKVCEEQQIQPVVLFIPTKAHIYLPYATMPSVSQPEIEEMNRNRSNVEIVVRKAVETAGIPWLSLVPLFEKAAENQEFVYYETDTHWDTRGRELAAEETTSFLEPLRDHPRLRET